MFFGKSRKRKSDRVGTPEYEQYEESDNRQAMYDLQKSMREHGFKGGPGINKDRWIYEDNIFDINKPGGPGAEAWDMPDEEYEKLVALLAKLDAGLDSDKPSPEEVYGYDPTKACMNDVGFNRWLEKQYGTHVGNIASAITQNDLGRKFD